MHLWRVSRLGTDSYKEVTHIYGGIHKGSSYISMEEFTVGNDSYKEFTCIYGGIHIRSSHISRGGFI